MKTTVYLSDVSDFGRVNEIYKEFFTENYPARAAYQVESRLAPASAKDDGILLDVIWGGGGGE